jgi:hypothetical protein
LFITSDDRKKNEKRRAVVTAVYDKKNSVCMHTFIRGDVCSAWFDDRDAFCLFFYRLFFCFTQSSHVDIPPFYSYLIVSV